MMPVPSTLPFLSSLKVTYSLCERRVRLENNFLSPTMCHEQLESINHLISTPPSITYIEQEKVDGSVLGLVRKNLGIQHLTIRPEQVFIVLYTSPFEWVGREPRWGKHGPSKWRRLKVRIDTPSGKTMSTRGMNTTMRAWVDTRVSRHKTTLSWTKTIWAMVRSMRKMRRSTRRKVRWKINKLIMIWVSSIVHMHLLHSLASKAKIIQVTRTTTKHANVNFLTWIWSIFLHTSLGVEGWLVTRWVVGFG
jgi:hypothetical protein